MKTLLITGGNGLLGGKILHAAKNRFRLISTDLHKENLESISEVTYYTLDITDGVAIRRIFNTENPDYVVHTAAFTDVDGAESNQKEAWDVNVCGTENVANACKETGAKLIHLSTDYIFDGNSGPYKENDDIHPLGYYAETKWESEKVVHSILEDYVILRTMVLYGYSPHGRKNFVTWLIDALRDGQVVRIVVDQYGNPTLADDLANAILSCIERNGKGVYHAVGKDWLNRYEFALEIARVFDLNQDLIHRTTTEAFQQKAPRPLQSGLMTEKIQQELGIDFMSVSQGLKLMKQQMKDDVH